MTAFVDPRGWAAAQRREALQGPLVAVAFAAALWQSLGPFNHDVAWILIGARWLLDGAVIGRDIIDVNPPLIWWLSAPVAAAARVTGLGAAPIFIAFTIAAALAGLHLARLAFEQGGSPLARLRPFALAAAAVLLFAPGYDFGQREHLLLIGSLPYLAALDAAARGRRVGIGLGMAIGTFAALAFCLKPHFLLVPAIGELWVLARTRRVTVRVETAALAGAAALVAAAIWLWAPDYLFQVLPGALESYWTYNQPPRALVANFGLALLPLLGAALLLRRRGNRTADFLFVGAAAAFLMAALQLKGWPYHLLPGKGLAAMGCAAQYWGGTMSRRPVAAVAAVAAAVLVVFAAFSNTANYARSMSTPSAAEALRDRFAREPGEVSVFAFITSPRDVHPAVLAAEAEWVSPACCMHLLPAWVRSGQTLDRPNAARTAALRQLDTVMTRLEQRRPSIIVVSDSPGKLGFGRSRFDYLNFMSRFPRFRRLFGEYAEEQPIGDYRIFARR